MKSTEVDLIILTIPPSLHNSFSTTGVCTTCLASQIERLVRQVQIDTCIHTLKCVYAALLFCQPLAAGLLRAFVFLRCSPDLSLLQSVISGTRAGSPAETQNSLNSTSLLFAGTLSSPHLNLPSNPNFNSLRKCLWEE